MVGVMLVALRWKTEIREAIFAVQDGLLPIAPMNPERVRSITDMVKKKARDGVFLYYVVEDVATEVHEAALKQSLLDSVPVFGYIVTDENGDLVSIFHVRSGTATEVWNGRIARAFTDHGFTSLNSKPQERRMSV